MDAHEHEGAHIFIDPTSLGPDETRTYNVQITMSSAATEQAPTTPKKTPSKAPTKKTPKKAPQSAPEPEAEPEQQDSQKAVPEDEDDTNLTNGYGDEAEDAANDAQDQADDAADEGEQAAEGMNIPSVLQRLRLLQTRAIG